MMEILQFIFRGPGTFIGVCILVVILFEGLECVIKQIAYAFRGKPKKDE